jgi:hypothetical protein
LAVKLDIFVGVGTDISPLEGKHKGRVADTRYSFRVVEASARKIAVQVGEQKVV